MREDGRDGILAPVGGGLVAGVAAGLFGVGGGVLLVPLLSMVLHRSQHVAHATSLVAILASAVVGTARFAAGDAVAVQGGIALALGAVVGAQVGSHLLRRMSERGLRRLFAAVLIVLAVRFIVFGASGAGAVDGSFQPSLSTLMLGLHLLGGLAAGVTSAMLGVGGGVILVPLMTLAFGYGQHIAEGTSLAVIVPTALTGAAAHTRQGYTDWRLGLLIGVGGVVGTLAGASVALALDPTTLTRLFGVLMLAVGLPMLVRDRRGRTA